MANKTSRVVLLLQGPCWLSNNRSQTSSAPIWNN